MGVIILLTGLIIHIESVGQCMFSVPLMLFLGGGGGVVLTLTLSFPFALSWLSLVPTFPSPASLHEF